MQQLQRIVFAVSVPLTTDIVLFPVPLWGDTVCWCSDASHRVVIASWEESEVYNAGKLLQKIPRSVIARLTDVYRVIVWVSGYGFLVSKRFPVKQLSVCSFTSGWELAFSTNPPDLSLLVSDLPDSITVFVVFVSFIFFLSNRVIFSYRKPRMGFWLVQKLVTLNNREGAVAVIICTKSPNSVALAANCIKVVEVRLVMSPT